MKDNIMDNCKECGGKLQQTSIQCSDKNTGRREHKIGLVCPDCNKIYINN